MTDPYGEEVRTTTTTTAYDPVTDQEVRSSTVTRRVDRSNPLVWVLAVIAILAIVALVYMFVQANKRDTLTAEQALAAQNAAALSQQPYDASTAAFDQSVAAAQAANLANQAAAANASNQAMNQAAMPAAQQASADRAAAAADRAAAERAADDARAAASASRSSPVIISPAPDTSGATTPETTPPTS